MICRVHAGRAHLKQLQALAKKKTFTEKFRNKYREQFPQVDTVRCECKRHKAGCGCLSDTFARELETTSPIFSQAVKLQQSSLSACRHSFTMYKICTNGMADSVSSTGSWCAVVADVKTRMSHNAKVESTTQERY